MSPKTKFKERSVKGTDGSGNKYVKVGIADDKIKVTWFCGGSRNFTAEDLKEALDYANGLGTRDGMWFDMADSGSVRYHFRIKDGKLTASDLYGENGYVEWSKLLPELQAALQALAQ